MNEKWAEISENLRKRLDPGVFKVWVAPLGASVHATGVHLVAPNSFMAEWVERRLLPELRDAAATALGIEAADVGVEISVGEKAEARPESVGGIVGMALPRRPEQMTLPIKAAPLPQWKPGYSFEELVIGPSNSVAVAAARDICQNGEIHSLFVNASPGLGKTHLAQAAGKMIGLAGRNARLAYVTAEDFASRYVAAMRNHELEDFKSSFCELDVLLLEDVHFFQRKKAMQEMVLGIIKHLQSRGSRVVFTSSFSPREMQNMDSQLISHFCSGILTSIGKPTEDMRRQILARKAKSFQVLLPDSVSSLLASRLSGDVRQLESCLKSMIFKARLLNCGLSEDLALEVLGQYAGTEVPLDFPSIVRLVCQSFGLDESQLRSKSRKKGCVQGRSTIFYLARKHTDLSLQAIGTAFNRSHSSVMRSITAVEREMARQSAQGRQIARTVQLIERQSGLAQARA